MANQAADEAPTDGRSLRSVRSRRAVVDAFLDLVHEGELRPTTHQVAERSGVSPSTIFRLFDDLEAMQAEAMAAQIARVSHLLVEIPSDGPLVARVARLAAARSRLYEALAPTLRFQQRAIARWAGARTNRALRNEHFRTELAELFAAELDGLPPATLDSIDALTSWEAWERLRSAQGLAPQEAEAVVERWLLDALGGGERPTAS